MDRRDNSQSLQLYTIFHLNLMFSSIHEEQRAEVIRRCYWPVLRLAETYRLPFGIEASGYTLETIAGLDADWTEKLSQLLQDEVCEFVGCGYAQLIGPLVPAEVNRANLWHGHQVYEKLLGVRPTLALVNEQAYSAGLIRHYLDAGYRGIIMEWDNPSRFHPEWNPEWRYFPQIACDQYGEEIPLIWNNSIAFQKFQRYVHDELTKREYLKYLSSQLTGPSTVFPLYGNDVEVFDFRPGRYKTEEVLKLGEWQRIERLFCSLLADERFHLIRPSDVLKFLSVPEAGNRLHLESPSHPIPVKKQEKYNITRWAVTGRDDLNLNTRCWRLYEILKKRRLVFTERQWRELCYFWSSDFRTHITEKRWRVLQDQLHGFEEQFDISCIEERRPSVHPGKKRLPAGAQVARQGRYFVLDTESVHISLNCRRGLAIDSLRFKSLSDTWLCGTLAHGYYDDIQWGADYYSGHLVFEAPGQAKITDLNRVEPSVEYAEDEVHISGVIPTPVGDICKCIGVSCSRMRVSITYILQWPSQLMGALRIGHITLNPAAFERQTLFFRTTNGGWKPETFAPGEKNIDHSKPISFLVSAESGCGLTDGMLEIGDHKHVLSVRVDKSLAALLGMVKFHPVGPSYLCRALFSAGEMDETSRVPPPKSPHSSSSYKISIEGLQKI